MSGLTRRGMLGASIVSLAPMTTNMPTSTTMPVANPDAGLLDLCAEFHEAHNASHAADDDSWEAYLAQRWEIFDEIEALTPLTEAGKWAFAGVALVLLEENSCASNAHERFATSALRGLVGRAAA